MVNFYHFYILLTKQSPIPVAAWPEEWTCGLVLAGIVGSNPSGSMDVCLFCVWCQVEASATELITRPEESYGVWYV
jgi:hypothetical protein